MISLAQVLKPAGMDPTDVQLAQISPDDVGPALTSGAIFAGIPASIKVREQLLADGSVIDGPSAVSPDGISPAFVFFGKSLLNDDPALAKKILEGFADLYKNYLASGYQNDPTKQAEIAKVLDYDPATVPTLVKEAYPADLSFPDGWTKNAENVWRGLPDVLSYKGSIADKVVDQKLIDSALKSAG
jgi:ABC-type taurine transport system substrate-binding protein